MTRLVVAVVVLVAVAAWAVRDLNKTLNRALRLPEPEDYE